MCVCVCVKDGFQSTAGPVQKLLNNASQKKKGRRKRRQEVLALSGLFPLLSERKSRFRELVSDHSVVHIYTAALRIDDG